MLFTEPFEKFGHMLEKDRILICEGDVSFDDFSGGNRMNARNIIEIGEARSHFAKAVAINVHGNDVTQAWLETFEQTLTPWRNGVVPVTINYAQDHASGKITLGDEWRVNPSDELMLALESMLGSTNVKIVF
jgi:DNA polymerase-3 subunit alpha